MTDQVPAARRRTIIRRAIGGQPHWKRVAADLGLQTPDGRPWNDLSQLRNATQDALVRELAIDVDALMRAEIDSLRVAPQPAPVTVDEIDADEIEEIEITDTTDSDDTPDSDEIATIVRDVLSGSVDGLRERVTSLAERAVTAEHAPPVVVRAADGSAAASVPPAQRRGTDTLQSLFNLRTADGKRTVSVWDGRNAPPIDRGYLWTADLLVPLAICDVSGDHAWLSGPPGTGKTTAVIQYAARTGRPMVRIACHEDTSAAELIGGVGIDDSGKTVYQTGSLVDAIRRPGTLVLLDEPTTVKPAVQAMLHGLLDGAGITLPSGEHVMPADGVMVWAADNTTGIGDSTGLHAGTHTMNAALIDRFAITLHVGYLDTRRETKKITTATGIAKEAAAMLVSWAQRTRAAAESGEILQGVGPRRLVSLATLLTAGIDPQRASDLAVFRRLDEAESEPMRQLWNAEINEAALGALARGEAEPPATSTEFSAVPDDSEG